MDIETQFMQAVPVLPLRGLVVFPGTVLHFDVARKKSVAAINAAMQNGQYIFMTSQKDAVISNPETDDLCSVGILAKVLQIVKLNENVLRVVAEGVCRADIIEISDNGRFFEADLEKIDITPLESEYAEAEVNIIHSLLEQFVEMNPNIPQDILVTVHEMTNTGKLADYIADNFIRNYHKKQEILETFDEGERLFKVIEMFEHEIKIFSIEEEINRKTKENLDKNQQDYYLREKIKAIHEELGDDDVFDETDTYRNKIFLLKTTDENKEKLLKEVSKLEKMAGNSAEANVIRSYLDACIELPWGIYKRETTNIQKIKDSLDKSHYGLEKVKESIIEAIAVRKLNPKANGKIICLAGPPGVGKTSIARAVADSIGRNYQRVALGGVHDEAEIRGHRRTYIGAMMGRVMYAINQAGSANPLILFDEIDKLGNDYHGDPTSALLEVLDGEQNSTFFDHYIDLPFDLSKVMFITTANDFNAIPAPLRDRMDIIHIESYTREEKFHIAKEHLIKKQLKRTGLTSNNFKIDDNALYDLIDSYTREAGVRSLERKISSLMSKSAVKVASDKKTSVHITLDNVEDYLGSRKYKPETISKKDEIGLVTGLAWTSVGGETLPVEVAVMNGRGKLQLTGSLGDVMKESAHAAYTCVRTMADELNIDENFYKEKDIHIHVPEGAVPKDGPSAGVTMTTAIISALSKIPVRRDVAMTGEITIRGRVLPIGGLKEKTMAAYRIGIKTIIIPEANKSDLDEVDDVIKNSIKFVFADDIRTVLKTALVSDFDKRENQESNTTEINSVVPETTLKSFGETLQH